MAPNAVTANSGMFGKSMASTWPDVVPLFFKEAANLSLDNLAWWYVNFLLVRPHT
jgi:hypothetical protein